MLKVQDLCVNYGAIRAVRGISFEVNQGEIVALIGGNGAGKSTTVRAIMGQQRVASGHITFEGHEMANKKTAGIVRAGIGLVPEGRRVFTKMTVSENIEIGGYTVQDKAVLHRRTTEVLELFPVLADRRNQLAATLSGGEQQMLAIARGLVAGPRLLLLDEPSLGLAPVLVERIFSMLEEISRRGTTLFLVEQKAYLAMRLSHRAYVMETGEIIRCGSTSELLQDDFVAKAYLGVH
jgi:branched-chain amino acid transport system ATP-binding protein